MSTAITVTNRGAAEELWVLGDRIAFTGKVPGTALSLLEVEVPPGSGTPPHTHASPEVFRVLDGELAFGLFDRPGGREVTAAAGTVVEVPSQVPHCYRNAGPRPARVLVVVDQSMVDFFRTLGRTERPEAGPPSAADIARVRAACARHHIELLGAPPA